MPLDQVLKTQAQVANTPAPIYAAKVSRIVSPTDIHVVAPTYSDFEYGPVKLAGSQNLAVGDECLLQFDSDSNPWISKREPIPVDLATQVELDTINTALDTRLDVLESWQAGSKGFGRFADLVSGTFGVGNLPNTGWTFSESSLVDHAFYQLGTPPGTPAGVAATTNSGIKVLQDGFYRIQANLLCQGASAGGRYDSNLLVLTSAGVPSLYMDEHLMNQPAGVGAAHIKFTLHGEWKLLTNQWIWAQNVTANTYGDSTSGWSNLTVRYMGT